jgi:hypothetical protein
MERGVLHNEKKGKQYQFKAANSATKNGNDKAKQCSSNINRQNLKGGASGCS